MKYAADERKAYLPRCPMSDFPCEKSTLARGWTLGWQGEDGRTHMDNLLYAAMDAATLDMTLAGRKPITARIGKMP